MGLLGSYRLWHVAGGVMWREAERADLMEWLFKEIEAQREAGVIFQYGYYGQLGDGLEMVSCCCFINLVSLAFVSFSDADMW